MKHLLLTSILSILLASQAEAQTQKAFIGFGFGARYGSLSFIGAIQQPITSTFGMSLGAIGTSGVAAEKVIFSATQEGPFGQTVHTISESSPDFVDATFLFNFHGVIVGPMLGVGGTFITERNGTNSSTRSGSLLMEKGVLVGYVNEAFGGFATWTTQRAFGIGFMFGFGGK